MGACPEEMDRRLVMRVVPLSMPVVVLAVGCCSPGLAVLVAGGSACGEVGSNVQRQISTTSSPFRAPQVFPRSLSVVPAWDVAAVSMLGQGPNDVSTCNGHAGSACSFSESVLRRQLACDETACSSFRPRIDVHHRLCCSPLRSARTSSLSFPLFSPTFVFAPVL
jgi:hypothetical protein